MRGLGPAHRHHHHLLTRLRAAKGGFAVTELVETAEERETQIKARAHTTEKSGRVPTENILALRGIGYFDIVKPRAFGGYEYDFDVLVDLNIDLAKACAGSSLVTGLSAGLSAALAPVSFLVSVGLGAHPDNKGEIAVPAARIRPV